MSRPGGSVVVPRRLKVHVVRSHPVHEAMLAVDPPRPPACKIAAEGLGLPDASERIPTDRFHELQDPQSLATVSSRPEGEVAEEP